MINLKKIAAVTLAAAMCLGMSMTAFAEDPTNVDGYPAEAGTANNALQAQGFDDNDLNESAIRLRPQNTVNPNTGEIKNGRGVYVRGTNGDGETNPQLTLSANGILANSEAANSVNTTEEIANIFKENGLVVPAGTDIIAIAAGVIDGLSDEYDNVLTFTLPATDFSSNPYEAGKYHPGDEIWAMFETGENTGVWEMRSGVINGNGEVDFTVDHKGAFILVKTMKNGRIVVVETDGQGNELPPVVIDPEDPGTTVTPSDSQGTSNNAAAGAATTGTSPKTGEF